MCNSRVTTSLVIVTGLLANAAGTALGGGIAIGQSTLVAKLDYSDSFTLSANGGEAGRAANAFPVGSPGIAIEKTYANPAQNWTDAQWSVSSDSTVINGSPSYPGSSGAGSASGMTQTGLAANGSEVYGLNYAPARSDYVAQFDAVQTADWINITSSSAPNTISAANSVSVLFRQDGGALPSIGIFSTAAGETAVPGATTGVITGSWNNYAVEFDHNDNTLSIYVNQALKASVNLATFDGGAYKNYSNAAISFGGAAGGGSRLWSDNVQIGTPTPEPSTYILAVFGLAGLVAAARRRK